MPVQSNILVTPDIAGGSFFCFLFLLTVTHQLFSREDMENVSDVVDDEKLERLPISKIGKSKSEEVDVIGDRSSTGTSGEKS